MKFTDAAGVEFNIHDSDQCGDKPCSFHRPSAYRQVSWPIIIRESGLVERLCTHGVGHPDPDSIAYLNEFGPAKSKNLWNIHGCDGCCRSGS